LKKGQETKVNIKDLVIYHQNLPKKQVKKHSHPEAHLFIPIRGSVKITYDDTTVNVPAGKMLFLSGGTKHSFESSDEQGERIIVLLKSNIKESSILPANSLLKELLFHILIDPKSVSSIKSVSLLKNLLVELLSADIFDVSILHSKAKDDRVVQAIEIMDSNLDLDISAVAKSAGTSSKTLTRLFKSELNITPKQAQTALRIDRARTLIARGNKNVTEVAFEVGFNSLSSFIKNYREITGNLPSQDQGR
jgi:AraC-like DNA-binding protein